MLRHLMLLALEAVVVGACLAAMLWILRTVGGPGPFSSPVNIALVGFAAGALFHLAFEAAGLNSMYCTAGHACAA